MVIDRGQDPVTGKRLRDWYSSFPTRKEAERARTKLLRELDTGAYVDPSKQTVAHFLMEEWLPARKPKQSRGARGHRGQVSLATWATHRDHLRAHVIPRIGRVPLQLLTAQTLDALYDQLEESGGRRGQGLSTTTVLHVHRILHKALGDALKQGKVAVNVAGAVNAPRYARAEMAVWTVPELRAFLDHVQGDRFYAAWLLFATTGMRRGEVAGLTTKDLDLDRGAVRVDWTLGVVDNKATWKPRPKSKAGERVMALDPATTLALRQHLERQGEQRSALDSAWRDRQADWRGEARSGLIFTWGDGSLIHPERFTQWFRDHRAAAGLPRIRLHDLRHTYATVGLARATGWHEVKVISKRLGHTSIGFTLDAYAHVLPAADEDTAHTLARHILGEGTQ